MGLPITGDDMADHSQKDGAGAEFKKAQRAQDAKNGMAEYEAEQAAVRAKTERLRALRLARDAALPPKPAAAPGKKKAGQAKKPAAKLSDWLDDQEKSGRGS
jgi:hypothetical protein